MADRVSQQMIKNKFGLFLEAIGGKPAFDYKDVGGYLLDYYNGYTIERIMNEKGGINQPFGSRRMKPLEFWYAMDFAIDAIEVRKGKR